MLGAEFNQAEFNEVRFNEAPSTFMLYLNPDGDRRLVGAGEGHHVPPSMLYPGSEYLLLLITSDPTVAVRFYTPPATYEGLGG